MDYYEKVAKTVGLSLLLTAIAGLIVVCLTLATDVFLLIFLAVLFAVFLTHTSRWLTKVWPLSYGWNLAILMLTLFLTSTAGVVYFGAAVEEKLQATSQHLDGSVRELQQWLDSRPYTKQALARVPFVGQVLDLKLSDEPEDSENPPSEPAGDAQQGKTESQQQSSQSSSPQEASAEKQSAELSNQPQDAQQDNSAKKSASQNSPDNVNVGKLLQGSSVVSGKVFPALGKIFSTGFGMLTSMAVVFFVGLFLAVNPQLYFHGVVQLFPYAARPKAEDVMQKMGARLFSWLGGRLLTMLITGAGTGIGLWLLGVPMAGTVGVVTALLTFVPNIGAVLALLLAMMLALSQGPATLVWVVALYCVLQLVESNILTPLIQQQKTSIPPALLISFQLLVGVLTGFLGLMVATPLLAASMVLIQEVWVKQVIERGEE